ncbi:MAG: DUF3048 domain-containing protein [Acidimicrobiales bacterium]
MDPATRRIVVVVVGVVLALSALGAAIVLAVRGGETAAPTTSAPGGSTSVPPATAKAVALAPLTGLPADPATLGRPALVVKIDDVDPAARPQGGLEQADVVYEEKIEGPNSRFAVVFQSTGADQVGPVRSGRTTDLAIVGPLNRPLYAFSGANATFLPLLRAGPLIDVGADTHPEAYHREPGREAPDNLFTSTEALWALAPGGSPPAPIFTFRPTGDAATGGTASPASGTPATVLAYDWGRGGVPIEYRWDPTRHLWLRWQAGTPHVDVAGAQLSAANLVVQRVPYRDTGVRDVAGTPVPEAQLVGSGPVTVLVDGRSIEGRWTKPDEATPTAFTDAAGRPIALTPGRTTVVLLPEGSEPAIS